MAQTIQHMPADIVAAMLVAGGATVAQVQNARTAWQTFAGQLPANPDDVVAVLNSDGVAHARRMPDGRYGRHLGFQVLVRGARDDEAFLKADAVRTFLAEGVRNAAVTVGAVHYLVLACSKISDVIDLRQEQGTTRFLYSINALLAVRQLS